MYPRIRYANSFDVDRILEIARQYRDELGYVHPAALREHIKARSVLVVEWYGNVWGFVEYHARRDGWSVVYHIAVDKHMTNRGLGRNLLYAVPTPFRLKVTQDNVVANMFYRGAGMHFVGVETGKKRNLNVYEMKVLCVLVFGNGKDDFFPRAARASGMAYGVRHCEQARAWPYMLDIDWRNYDWNDYLHKVARWSPVQATVADYEHRDQRKQLYRQIRDLRALGVLRIMVCPKFPGAISHIPTWCVTAISIPSSYAGYIPPISEVEGRRVHMLGGSPPNQRKWQLILQGAGARVISADMNSHTGAARKAGFWNGTSWKSFGPRKMTEQDYFDMIVESGRNISKMLNANVGLSQHAMFN